MLINASTNKNVFPITRVNAKLILLKRIKFGLNSRLMSPNIPESM